MKRYVNIPLRVAGEDVEWEYEADFTEEELQIIKEDGLDNFDWPTFVLNHNEVYDQIFLDVLDYCGREVEWKVRW